MKFKLKKNKFNLNQWHDLDQYKYLNYKMIPGKQETANMFKNPEQSQSFIEGKSTDFSKTASTLSD